MRHLLAALAALAAAGLGTAPAAASPDTAAAAKAPVQTSQAQSFSDDTIYRFAKAALNVRNVFSRNAEDLKSAQRKQEKKEIEERMRKEIREAVDNAGLTVEQYKKINQAMSQDPRLRQRVLQLVEQMGGGQSSGQ
ncbi:protein of unknown function [Limimonas halophila]|uniref:DUF4168 domain-containing protein n=1 Tax=Limimonas halophila TaxID=1082479 RepID=A0A1G7L3H4_9PROT|nr:DUF4168 domain-containing protein [Limimonas halophila]SDF44015.1 protein of unknown function [Limimonas halophila]